MIHINYYLMTLRGKIQFLRLSLKLSGLFLTSLAFCHFLPSDQRKFPTPKQALFLKFTCKLAVKTLNAFPYGNEGDSNGRIPWEGYQAGLWTAFSPEYTWVKVRSAPHTDVPDLQVSHGHVWLICPHVHSHHLNPEVEAKAVLFGWGWERELQHLENLWV